MKTLVTIEEWSRKEHFNFFSKFDEPFFGLTVTIDCTHAYRFSKENNYSFFLTYLYLALKAANEIENFRYRIVDGQVYMFDQIDASSTINRPDGTFGFGYIGYETEDVLFFENAVMEIERVRSSTDLIPATSGEGVIHFSAIPWLNFTGLSHARSFFHPDSCPKISFGKVTEQNGVKMMSVSIHAHHGLVDGYHVGLFVDRFQELMNLK